MLSANTLDDGNNKKKKKKNLTTGVRASARLTPKQMKRLFGEGKIQVLMFSISLAWGRWRRQREKKT